MSESERRHSPLCFLLYLPGWLGNSGSPNSYFYRALCGLNRSLIIFPTPQNDTQPRSGMPSGIVEQKQSGHSTPGSAPDVSNRSLLSRPTGTGSAVYPNNISRLNRPSPGFLTAQQPDGPLHADMCHPHTGPRHRKQRTDYPRQSSTVRTAQHIAYSITDHHVQKVRPNPAHCLSGGGRRRVDGRGRTAWSWQDENSLFTCLSTQPPTPFFPLRTRNNYSSCKRNLKPVMDKLHHIEPT